MSIRSNVDAQALDQRVRFERPVTDSNGDVTGWTPLATCWAKVDGAKASGEQFTEGGIRSVGDYTLWIRADIHQRFGLQLTDRVVWRGRYLDIKDMPDQQLRGRLIAVICKTGLTAG